MNAGRDDAAAKGSCVHDLVAEHYDKANHGDLSEWRDEQIEEAKPNAARVIAEVERRKWTVIGVELAMENPRFAGTPDLIVRDADGQVLIGDLKTSRTSAGSAEWVIQIGAYGWLYRGQPDSPMATAGAVIHAPFGEPLAVYPIDARALIAGEQAFRHLLDLHEIAEHVRVGEAMT